MRFAILFAIIFSSVLATLEPVHLQAQYFFSGNVDENDEKTRSWFYDGFAGDQPNLNYLTAEMASKFITISGTAEVRVPANAYRVVLAIVTEHEDVKKAKQMAVEKVAAIEKDLANKMNLGDEEIFEDFIAIFPSLEIRGEVFGEEKKEKPKHRLEQPSFYRYQTNLHIKLDKKGQVNQLIDIATDYSITDFVAIDYWADNIDALKLKARKKAIQAAKEKSDLYLALFDERPRLVNLQEATRTTFPTALYRSYQAQASDPWRGYYGFGGGVFGPTGQSENEPVKRIFYQRPPMVEADVREKHMPLESEITVVSTVVLYYEAPATTAKETKQDKK